jgi:hypothetical protein
MTEAANIERQKRQQAEFVTDDEHRLLEIEDARLAIKFGDKNATPIRKTKRSARSSSRPASTTRSVAIPTRLKRFSGNSMRSTRLQRRGL